MSTSTEELKITLIGRFVARYPDCRATTVRGMIRYARGHVPGRTPWLTRNDWLAQASARRADPEAKRARRDAWLARAHARRADPEAKRARQDAAYRRRYVRRLREEARRLNDPPTATLSEITAAADSARARRHRVAEIDRLLHISLGARYRGNLLRARYNDLPGVLIPCGLDDGRGLGMPDIRMLGVNATFGPTRKSSDARHLPGKTEWRLGSPVGYMRAVHAHWMRSFGVVAEEGRTLRAALHDREYVLRAPDRYSWAQDELGLMLRDVARGHVNYHVAASDVMAGIDHIVARVEASREARELAATRRAIERAELAGVWVCYRDSIAARNCPVGTDVWMREHGLGRDRHYRAVEVLDLAANGMARYVRAAVRVAHDRHLREIQRGYALLSEHASA